MDTQRSLSVVPSQAHSSCADIASYCGVLMACRVLWRVPRLAGEPSLSGPSCGILLARGRPPATGAPLLHEAAEQEAERLGWWLIGLGRKRPLLTRLRGPELGADMLRQPAEVVA